LKLLTSTSPATNRPVLAGTTATPYGFTSPFFGTVNATVLIVFNEPTNELAAAAEAAKSNAAPVHNSSTEAERKRWPARNRDTNISTS
jgi:hypothetical protein